MPKPSITPKEMFGLIGIAVWILVILIIGATVISRKVKGLTYKDICPDYFQTEYAYIVDGQGKGMDSVLVTLKDISNVNTIYTTFTDSNGRFTLFNDFYSFSLYTTPINFEMYVFFSGYADTLIYSFQKKRICHFEKISGPDTIVVSFAAEKYRYCFTLSDVKRVSVHELFDNPGKIAPPDATVLSGYITVQGRKLYIALIDRARSRFKKKEAVALAVDFDGNGGFDMRPGSLEFFESASCPIVLDQYLCKIDRFADDGTVILLQWQRPAVRRLSHYSVGTTVDETDLPIASRTTIGSLLNDNDFLILAFLADRAPDMANHPDVKALTEIIDAYLGAVELVWINRKRTTYFPPNTKIVDEAQGWEGPLITRFGNRRDHEIICINSEKKIVYRGGANRAVIETLWEGRSEEGKKSALEAFDAKIRIGEVVR